MNTFAVHSIVAIVVMAGSSGAVAQVQPPVREFVDENGVDLRTGEMTSVYVGPSIGSGPGRLGFARHFRATDIWDSYLGVISASGSVYSVTLDSITERFNASGGIYTPIEANGSTLISSGGTYTYTTRTGAVAVYDGRSADVGWPNSPGIVASLTTVTYPDGERLTTEYDQQTICVSHMGGCSGQVTTVRIKWITSNRGYRLSIDYFVNSPPVGDPMMFVRPKTIRLVNLGDGSVVGSVGVLVSTPDGSGTNWMELTDALGRTTRFNRSDTHGITSIRRPGSTFDNVAVSYWHSTLVSDVTRDAIETGYTYGDVGTNPVVRTTRSMVVGGAERVFTLDFTRQRLLSSGDALGRTTSFSYEYDGQGLLASTRVTQPEGNFVQYTYDSRGNAIQTLLGAKSGGSTITAATANFDATCPNRKTCNQPNWVIDGRANRTDFEYFPEHGGIKTITLPAPRSGAVRPQTRFSYTALQAWFQSSSGSLQASGEPIHLLTGTSTCRNSSTCAGTNDEIKTTIDYGPTGVPNNLLQRSVTTSNGTGTLASVASYGYDSVGNLLTVDGPISGTSDTTRMRYDAVRRVVGVIGPDPDSAGWRPHIGTRNTYNTAGDLVSVEKGTVNSQSDADWANFASFETVSSIYDFAGRRLRSTLTSGGTTYAVEQVTYDLLGRPDCVVQRMNPAAFASLPAWACELGPEGSFGPDRITKFGFDAATQVTTVTKGYGTGNAIVATSMTYTDNGKPQTVTDGKGNLTKYVYDGFDRLFQIFYPDPASPPGSHNPLDFEQRGYDANSNVTSVRARNGDVVNFVADALNRTDLVDLPSGEDVYFRHDNHGRLLSATHTSATGPGIVQTYDGLGRLDTRTSLGRMVDYDYDSASRRTRLTHHDAFYARYFYNVAGELTSIDDSTGVTLATFTYDALGRPDTITRGNGTLTDFGFDAVSRLNLLIHDLASTNYDGTSVFGHSPAHQIMSHTQTNDSIYSWAPPANSNSVMSYNGLNQLTQVNSPPPIVHDPLGNLETGASSFAFGYDVENRLRSADSTNPTVSLGYDPLGQLSEVIVNGTSTKFLYDGADLIAEYDDAGTLRRRYVHGVGTDEPVVWYEYDGFGASARYYFHADERGSVAAISNNSGAGTVSFKYSSDGEASNAASSRFGYTGQVWLSQPGLSYYKSRMYSPKLGRFLQTDAIGYGGGMNLYAYVAGDPINRIDPFARCEDPPCSTGPYPPTYDPIPSRFSPISDYDIWLADQHGGFVTSEHPEVPDVVMTDPLTDFGYEYFEAVLQGDLGRALRTGAEFVAGQWRDAFSTPESAVLTAMSLIPIVGAETAAAKGIVASNGTRVTGLTKHGVQRAIGDGAARAGVRPQAALSALKKPIKILEGVDGNGRPYQVFYGEHARVIVNPTTGKIVSMNPLSRWGAL